MREAITRLLQGMDILGSFIAVAGAIALVLAVAGVYSMMTQMMSRRRRELGIRMALGASRSQVMRTALHRAGLLTVVGIGIGVALAVALGQLLESSLLGIVGFDALALGLASLGLGVAALLAGWLPARRALRMDPAVILRSE